MEGSTQENKRTITSRSLRQRSISEPELNGGNTGLASGLRGRRGAAGLTVDQLCHYRRKQRPPDGIPRDNLCAGVGSLAGLKTEYCRQFRAPSLEALCCERAVRPSVSVQGFATGGGDSEGFPLDESEHKAQFRLHDTQERVEIMRRPNNLCLDSGPVSGETEHSCSFVAHELSPDLWDSKLRLSRVNTSLQLTGPADGQSEQRDMFKRHQHEPRRPLMKRSTNLHLEGDVSAETEHRLKYIQYDILNLINRVQTQRPVNQIQIPAGKMHGEAEYTHTYVAKSAPKSEMSIPRPHLKLEGDFILSPEYKDCFIRFPIDNKEGNGSKRPENSLKLEGTMTLKGEYINSIAPSPGRKDGSTKPVDDNKTVEDIDNKENKVTKNFEIKSAAVPTPNLKTESIFQTPSKQEQSLRKYPIEASSMVRYPTRRNDLMPDQKSGRNELMPEQKSGRNELMPEQKSGRNELRPVQKSNFPQLVRSRNPSPLRRGKSNLQKMDAKIGAYDDYTITSPRRSRPRWVSSGKIQNAEFEGRFECQPEYRKARMDMLIKEKLSTRQLIATPVSRPASPSKNKQLKSKAPSRSVSPSYKLCVSTPSIDETKDRKTTKLSPRGRRSRRPSQSPQPQLHQPQPQPRQPWQLMSDSEHGSTTPAFIVIDEPKCGSIRSDRSETISDMSGHVNINNNNIDLCNKNANWMPPWYCSSVQR